ncbi:MAG: SHOCT domain-containing protein [Bacilli bacterium]|nr:SHOCT domain-containing protein [Bacilli bacterium]
MLYSFSDFLYFTCLPFAIVALVISIRFLKDSPYMVDYLSEEIARLEGGEYNEMDSSLAKQTENRPYGLDKKEKKLKTLYEAGAITKVEYEEARKKYGLDY